jgi:hypothetical protein
MVGGAIYLPLSLIYNGKVQLEIECGATIYIYSYSLNLSRVMASSSSYMYVIQQSLLFLIFLN